MAKTKLTPKQAVFVKEYVKTKNGTKAALIAYDTTDYRTANNIASENLAKKAVIEALEALSDESPKMKRMLRDYYNYKQTPEYTEEIGTKHVYLIKSGDYHKIGIAKNVKSRMDSLNAANPLSLELVASSKCKQARQVERYLHDKYAEQRVKLEWFKLNDEQITEVITYMSGVSYGNN